MQPGRLATALLAWFPPGEPDIEVDAAAYHVATALILIEARLKAVLKVK